MKRYAQNTQVSVSKSKVEIEKILSKYGAEQFAYGWNQKVASIGFKMNNRFVRFELPMPDKNSDEFLYTPTKRIRESSAAERLLEQAQRQSWRALCLVIKAKLEAIEAGIATFEDEFLSYIALPNGKTVGEETKPLIAQAYETGKVPLLLTTGN